QANRSRALVAGVRDSPEDRHLLDHSAGRRPRTIPRDVSTHAMPAPATGDGEGATATSRQSATLFDIPIDLAEPTELLRTISAWASQHTTKRVMYVNAHVV